MVPLGPAAAPAAMNLTETPSPVEIDGFAAALEHGAADRAGSFGGTLLDGLGGFSVAETSFNAAVARAYGPAPAAPRGAEAAPVSQAEMMQQLDANQQKSMGVMMQTYSFALEATLVSNAATTFTSSINTLIKTQ